MAVGQLHRRKTTITVHVANQRRRFVLRAHSVVDELGFSQLRAEVRARRRETQATSTVVAARTNQAALVSLAVGLLQEPADNGEPLSEEDGWNLRLGDPARVLAAHDELQDLAKVLGAGTGKAESPEEVADSWLDVASVIAQARLAPDAQAPLSDWSIEQLCAVYWRAAGVLWDESAERQALQGIKPGPRPDFKHGRAGSGGVDSAPFTAEDEVKYAAMKVELEARYSSGDKPVYPGDMGRAEKQAFVEVHFDQTKAQANTHDPDGRKFPGML